jgi:hypothetical protein
VGNPPAAVDSRNDHNLSNGRTAQNLPFAMGGSIRLDLAQQRSLIHLARHENPDGVNDLTIAKEVSDFPDRVQRR